MARLGELLVAATLLTPEQLEQALRAQVMWGGRLGTNIIELGFLDLDQLSDALGRQHGMPAALARHFDLTNAALQRKLSPELAAQYSAVPLMQVASGRIVIASLGKIEPRGIEIIADELESASVDIVISVAAELRIRYHLERAFGIPRGARFLRSRGKTIPPFPAFVTEPLNFEDSQVSSPLPIAQREQLAELHAQTVAEEASQSIERESLEEIALEALEALEELEELPLEEIEAIEQVEDSLPLAAEDCVTQKTETLEALGAVAETRARSAARTAEDEKAARERRKYVRMLSDVPSTESERRKLGRIAIRRVQVASPSSHVAKTLGEATRAIRRSTDRDKVAELVMLTLEKFVPSLEATVMLVLRGDVAIGWKGYGCGGQALPEVAVPLGEPGLIPKAISHQLTMRAPSGELGSIDQLLLTSLGANGDKELVVVPVMIAGQVMLVMVLVAAQGCEIQSAESIAVATGAAFARLMRDASR